ncbi:MAG: peptidyl-prolyl cis-trans isomerase, partial [Gemmatimonadetes bacterium]|nr:peptidyl-prolyl cis-trans isomerase [Gemmatimonadota bacterium]
EYIYAFRLVELRAPRTLPFEEVADQARFSLAQERRAEIARTTLEQAVAASDGTLPSIAEQLDAAVQSPGPFSRDSFVPGVGRRNGFVAAAFRLAEDERSGIVESDRGYYVLEVVKRIPADESLFAEQRDQLRGQILLEKRQTLITAWMEQLLRNAVVEDFRGGGESRWEPSDDAFLYAPA